MGHNSILRVRYEKGWVTMRGVDGTKILGPVRGGRCLLLLLLLLKACARLPPQPNAMVDAKMAEAAKKLLEGQYKKAAMEFSKVIRGQLMPGPLVCCK